MNCVLCKEPINLATHGQVGYGKNPLCGKCYLKKKQQKRLDEAG